MQMKFIDFLRKHRVVRKFKHNLRNYFYDNDGLNPEADMWMDDYDKSPKAIDAAFTWADTPEGHEFWALLNSKWYYTNW